MIYTGSSVAEDELGKAVVAEGDEWVI